MAGEGGEEEDEDIYIQLNMDHPFNKSVAEFLKNAPDGVANAFFVRMARRGEFNRAIDSIGGLTKYRRKVVVRSLIRMFRAGFECGHVQGHNTGYDDGLNDGLDESDEDEQLED